ncbi:hypothetical protein BU17DRAFT_91739 [Hysterangium stoloniferum]|nr:hypothetical protein BU17DRAFT_91739 [Hysterangium stoloniferum]
MTLHKRLTNERDLVRRHTNRSPALDVPRAAPDLASIIEAQLLSAESAENARTRTLQKTPPVKTVISSVTSLPSVATSPPLRVTPSTTPIPSVVSKITSVNPVVSTPSTISSSTSSTSSTSSSSTFSSPKSTSSSLPIPPVPSAGDAQNQGQSNAKGVSSGGIAAIVVVIVLLAVGLVAFFWRKIHMRRRAIKRNTWGAGLVPALGNRRDTVYGDARPSQMSETPAGNPISVFQPPSPPPASYLSTPPPVSAFTPPSIQQPINKTLPSIPPAGPTVEVAVVARTFIPTLPDELHISNGEQIHVLNAFDDGWALCTNIRGDKGVVPVECLQRFGAPAEMQLQPQSELGYGSEKAIKRLSSLTSNARGTY